MSAPRRPGAGMLLAVPATAWLMAAFAAPLAVVVLLALQEDTGPFVPLASSFGTAQFDLILGDPFTLRVIAETVLLGLGVTAACVLLGYPLALWLVRLPPRWRALGFAVILIPLLTNVVVRSLGIVLLLAPDGLINQALGLAGIPRIEGMLYTHGAVALALAQVFMPFVVLALFDVLQSVPPRVREAAESLGAGPVRRFWAVDFPLSLPGLRAGLIIVFLLSSTAYVSATLLGGRKVFTTGMLVWQEALQNLNAPFAAALALVMTAIGIGFAALTGWAIGRATPWLRARAGAPGRATDALARILEPVGTVLARLLLGLALFLLLLPLVLVAVQSFNDVPQATAAGFRDFTLRWYADVLGSDRFTGPFVVSLQLAAASAAVAILLALPAAFALARAPFPGLPVVAAFWTLPLSLPHVAIGVGMLRLLQEFTSLPAFLGLMAVHVVLILPFCIGLLRASVLLLDRAQEEAAESLGAGAVRRFLLVVLPGLAPGLAASGIIAFLLSFAEVTVTAFLTTARMTTLPVRIYADASFSLEPTVHAVSTLLIAVTVLALLAVNRLVRLDRVFAR
jgi:putative spermidine/putrescine transport system permease protein